MAQEAGRCLQVHGFVAESGHQENHHLTYMSPEGIRLELHSALVEPFDSTEVNTFWKNVRKIFLKTGLLKMSWEWIFSWPRHHIRHFICYYICCNIFCVPIWLKTSLRLGCILGTWMYGRGGSKILTLVRECGILNFTCVVTLFCVRYLGLSENKVQFLKRQEKPGQ